MHDMATEKRSTIPALDRAEEWAEFLEAGGRAVLRLDAAGRVVSISPAAAGYFGGRVQLRNARLSIADSGVERLLVALIQAALRHDPLRPAPLPPPLVLRRASGRHLHIDVLPIPHVAGAGPTKALLLLRETEGDAGALSRILRERFRLTPAELRLALALADGIGLAQAAEALGICLSTARVQLKSIFLKTETHRQAELVALLARLA